MQVLLFHDQNYGIHYEYTIPVNATAENRSEPEKPQDSLFIWTHSGWEGCSVQCGGGERRVPGVGVPERDRLAPDRCLFVSEREGEREREPCIRCPLHAPSRASSSEPGPEP